MSEFVLTGLNKDNFAIYLRALFKLLPFPHIIPIDTEGTSVRLKFIVEEGKPIITLADLKGTLEGRSHGPCYETITAH